MSFITDNTVIAIKLTAVGRELLSKGELKFTQYSVGDSEIDYDFIRENDNYAVEDAKLLRPLEHEPNQVSFLSQRRGGNTILPLRTPIENVVTTVSNTANPRGVYNTKDNVYYSDSLHVKEANAAVDNSTISGGTGLTLIQGENYTDIGLTPVVGDYIFVRWGNPLYSGSSSTSLTGNTNIVQLTYKILAIYGGSITNNNLSIEVDRELPDFGGEGFGKSRVLVYPNNNDVDTLGNATQVYYGQVPQVTDLAEFQFSLLENYDKRNIDVAIWNFTNIFRKDIEGVQMNDVKFAQLPSKDFGNFLTYIQRLDSTINNIGVVHYSNLSPSNIYGEGFFYQENIESRLPRLTIPHVMWYNNDDVNSVLVLKTDFKSFDMLPDINTVYFNLVDGKNMVVGKVFPDLKLFVIEDQELLAALSYKSNRNYTLPKVEVNLNLSLCDPIEST